MQLKFHEMSTTGRTNIKILWIKWIWREKEELKQKSIWNCLTSYGKYGHIMWLPIHNVLFILHQTAELTKRGTEISRIEPSQTMLNVMSDVTFTRRDTCLNFSLTQSRRVHIHIRFLLLYDFIFGSSVKQTWLTLSQLQLIAKSRSQFKIWKRKRDKECESEEHKNSI